MDKTIIISISLKILANILWVRVHGVVHRSLSKMVCNNGADSTKHYIASVRLWCLFFGGSKLAIDSLAKKQQSVRSTKPVTPMSGSV